MLRHKNTSAPAALILARGHCRNVGHVHGSAGHFHRGASPCHTSPAAYLQPTMRRHGSLPAILLRTPSCSGQRLVLSRFGRKRFLIACIVIFTVASFACGAATNLAFF